MILKSVHHVVNYWVVATPARQGQVISPQRRRVGLLHKGRDVVGAIQHTPEEVPHFLVILEELGQRAEDRPRFLLSVIVVVVDDVVCSLGR